MKPPSSTPGSSARGRLLTAAGTDVGFSVPAIFPSEAIDKLFRFLVDRFRKPATPRVSQQAMIVSAVRIQHLIALLPRQSSLTSDPNHRNSLLWSRPVGFGLFEDEPQCHHNDTDRWRGSARNRPQLYGKSSALLFDIEGLITWLRQRFPRATAISVEAETRIPAASVENWLHRRSQPSVEHFMILLTAFGPPFLHACLKAKPDWVEEAAVTHRNREIDEEIARLQGERRKVVAG